MQFDARCFLSFQYPYTSKVQKKYLVRVLFAAALEFPTILVPRLPQNTSSVNIESTEKSKQVYYYVTNFLES